MKKIAAFISKFSREDGFNLNSPPDVYTAFDNTIVTGRQTNEAPIRYLLTRYSGIEEVICVCTPDVLKPDERFGISPLDYLKKSFPDVHFVPIDYEPQEYTFEQQPLPAILEHIRPEDTIYLETTGGFRDAVSQLLLLSRILLYQGTKLELAVYSDFNVEPKRIKNVTDTYRAYDLINGLNEFDMFGSALSLDRYYREGSRPPQVIQNLVDEMNRLSECITLCRTRRIDYRVKKVQEALEKAEADESVDPVMRLLLPIFGEKFKSLTTTPQQIRWCAENNLIQQALTIYTDRLPRYLMEEKHLVLLPDEPEKYFDSIVSEYAANEDAAGHTGRDKSFDSVKAFKSKDKYNYVWNEDFLRIGKDLGRLSNTKDNAVATIENLADAVKSSDFRISDGVGTRDMQKLLKDYLYAMVLRNQLNHVNEELKPQEERAEYLRCAGYKVFMDSLTLANIKGFITSAMDTLEQTVSKIR